VVVADLDRRRGGQAAAADQFLAVDERHHVVGPAVQDRRVLLDGAGGPYLFQAGQSRTSGVSPLSRFMATAPPRDEPTTTAGWYRSNSAWAMRTASSKSSSGSVGSMTS
jgi:hypothetical protein